MSIPASVSITMSKSIKCTPSPEYVQVPLLEQDGPAMPGYLQSAVPSGARKQVDEAKGCKEVTPLHVGGTLPEEELLLLLPPVTMLEVGEEVHVTCL